MNNKVMKSKVISNSHQIVCTNDKRTDEFIEFVNSLYAVYGDKRPIKYAACCNTVLTFLGKGGYLAHNKSVTISLKDMMSEGKVTKSSLIEKLEMFNLGAAGVVSLPGVNLYHTTYLSLEMNGLGSTAKKANPAISEKSQVIVQSEGTEDIGSPKCVRKALTFPESEKSTPK